MDTYKLEQYLIEKVEGVVNQNNARICQAPDGESVWRLAEYLWSIGNNNGYILIAEWRLRQGDWYRVEEALGNASKIKRTFVNSPLFEETDVYKEYYLRCAQVAIEIIKKEKRVPENLMQPIEIAEAFMISGKIMQKEIKKVLLLENPLKRVEFLEKLYKNDSNASIREAYAEKIKSFRKAYEMLCE